MDKDRSNFTTSGKIQNSEMGSRHRHLWVCTSSSILGQRASFLVTWVWCSWNKSMCCALSVVHRREDVTWCLSFPLQMEGTVVHPEDLSACSQPQRRVTAVPHLPTLSTSSSQHYWTQPSRRQFSCRCAAVWTADSRDHSFVDPTL